MIRVTNGLSNKPELTTFHSSIYCEIIWIPWLLVLNKFIIATTVTSQPSKTAQLTSSTQYSIIVDIDRLPQANIIITITAITMLQLFMLPTNN